MGTTALDLRDGAALNAVARIIWGRAVSWRKNAALARVLASAFPILPRSRPGTDCASSQAAVSPTRARPIFARTLLKWFINGSSHVRSCRWLIQRPLEGGIRYECYE